MKQHADTHALQAFLNGYKLGKKDSLQNHVNMIIRFSANEEYRKGYNFGHRMQTLATVKAQIV